MRLFVPLLCASLGAAPALAADAAHPTVIELYQSQGCSSCPPADMVVNAVADRPDVLALSFAVTYWDQLGWKDSFGDPAYTKRQWDFAKAGGRGNVATPQVIVNGKGVLTGNRRGDVDTAIQRYDRGNGGPAINSDRRTVVIGDGKDAGTVWLVRYDPRTISVAIGAGENNGRTIPHRNIVRQLVPLGRWAGTKAQYALPQPRGGLASAVLIQAGTGGPIIAVRKL